MYQGIREITNIRIRGFDGLGQMLSTKARLYLPRGIGTDAVMSLADLLISSCRVGVRGRTIIWGSDLTVRRQRLALTPSKSCCDTSFSYSPA